MNKSKGIIMKKIINIGIMLLLIFSVSVFAGEVTCGNTGEAPTKFNPQTTKK